MKDSELFNEFMRCSYSLENFNCYHFVKAVYSKLGVLLPDTPSLSITGFKKIEKPIPHCLVLFQVKDEIDHIGIVSESCVYFYHNVEGSGVRKDSLNSRYWKPKIRGFYACENK